MGKSLEHRKCGGQAKRLPFPQAGLNCESCPTLKFAYRPRAASLHLHLTVSIRTESEAWDCPGRNSHRQIWGGPPIYRSRFATHLVSQRRPWTVVPTRWKKNWVWCGACSTARGETRTHTRNRGVRADAALRAGNWTISTDPLGQMQAAAEAEWVSSQPGRARAGSLVDRQLV